MPLWAANAESVYQARTIRLYVPAPVGVGSDADVLVEYEGRPTDSMLATRLARYEGGHSDRVYALLCDGDLS